MGKVLDLMKYKNKKTNPFISNERVTNKLYILIGIPCSGKSTYANKRLDNANIVIVSTDEIRKELTGTYIFSQETNDRVFDIAKSEIQLWLDKGYDVVFDATNTNKKYRKKFIDIGIKNNSRIIGVVFMTPLRICLIRNSVRDCERQVPEDIIVKMSGFNPNIDDSEGFNEVIFVGK